MKRSRGRPNVEISKTEFEKLCGLHCTMDEISAFFACSHDTVERWCKRTYKMKFNEVYKEKQALGKVSLRRSQFRLAQKNVVMAIWLGKQYLGQKEEQTVNQNFSPIVIKDDLE